MDVDPAASMRCWEVDIELDRWTYTIPALPAADWWTAIRGGRITDLTDLISEKPDPRQPKRPLLDDLIPELEPGELTTALNDAIEEACGRSMHAAVVLVSVAADQWPSIGGAIAKAGFRWDVQPIGAALDLVYFIVASALEEKKREEFDALLENESLTAGKPTERQRAKAVAEFEEIAGPRPTSGARSQSTGAPSGSERTRTRRRPRPPRPGAPSPAPTSPPG